MAQFRISESFALESRNLFVLAGDVIAGRIVAGMQVAIPFNGTIALTVPIHAVGYIRRSSSREEVGLCIKYQDSEELEVWRGLNIGSEVVDVSA